jgi:hypothetical protein
MRRAPFGISARNNPGLAITARNLADRRITEPIIYGEFEIHHTCGASAPAYLQLHVVAGVHRTRSNASKLAA